MSGAGGRAERCAWCGAALAGARSAGRITVCPRCGSGTTDPPPTAAELDRAYAGWYRPESGRFSGPGDRVLSWSRGLLARRLDRIAPPGPVLDVGSGEGSLLRALRAQGREAQGLEREADPAAGVRGGALADQPADSRWAAVVFWHSLEHLAGAGEVLAAGAARLADEGVVVVALPNFASMQSRAFGENWLARDLPRHLVHVPATALVARMQQLGLRVERVSHIRGGQVMFGWLHGLVGALPGHPDLYGAVRQPEARSEPVRDSRRAATLAAGVALSPVAAIASAGEIAMRRGGSVYVEARRPRGATQPVGA